MTGSPRVYMDACVNGESHGGLCERRGGVDLLAVDPHPPLAEPIVALHRAYHAWIRTQPQLILDLWDDAGLEQEGGGAGHALLFEPVPTPSQTSPRGGLTAGGTEPRHAARTDGKQSPVSGHPFPSCRRVVVGAALSTTTEADASSYPGTRVRLQGGL